MASTQVSFINYCKFSPAMLQNHLWRRLKTNAAKPERKEPEDKVDSFNSPLKMRLKQNQGLEQFRRKQHLGKKRVSFRQDLVLKRSTSFEGHVVDHDSSVEKTNGSASDPVGSTVAPSIETINSVLLFVDISGFTRLCTRLNPETTRFHINTYFTLMMDIIFKFGGDVHKFIGDAIIVIWPIKLGETKSEVHKTALTALSCAFALVNSECSHYDKEEGDVSVTLRMHIGITYGMLHCYHVGTNDNGNNVWEYLVAGKPLGEMASALDNAKHGEIGVSPAFFHDLIKDQCIATEHESGNYIIHSFCSTVCMTEELGTKFLPSTLKINAEPCSINQFLLRQQESMSHRLLPFKLPVVSDAVAGMVPRVARHHCQNNSLQFLSELRNVTIMFINIASLIPSLDAGELSKVQLCMEIMSSCVYDKQGTFVQFVYDDKGVVAIAAFGLPGMSHENDVHRGLLCALTIHSALDDIGLFSHIGITRGKVYCGLVGSEYRCAFGIMGASMNLSARLMGACMKMNRNKSAQQEGRNIYILCNETVKREALADPNCSFTFQKLDPIKAKGYDQPVNVYVPRRTMARTDSKRNFIVSSIQNKNKFYYNAEVDAQEKGTRRSPTKLVLLGRNNFVGRENEMTFLKSYLRPETVDSQPFTMLFIIGDAGIGKSTLLRYFAKHCLESDRAVVLSLRGDGDSLGAPLVCWGHVVRTALKGLYAHYFPNDADVFVDKKGKKTDITQDAGKTKQILNTVLDFRQKSKLLLLASFFPSLKGIPLNTDIQAIKGSKQGTMFQVSMIIDLLIKYVGVMKNQIVLMIEDAHYLDYASWNLLQQVTELCPANLLIVNTTRPIEASQKVPAYMVKGYNHLTQAHEKKVFCLHLEKLSQDACTELLQKILNTPLELNRSYRALTKVKSQDRLQRTRNLESTSRSFEPGDDDDLSIQSLNSSDDNYEDLSEEENENVVKIKNFLHSPKLSRFVYERCNGNPLFLLGLAEVIQSEYESVETAGSSLKDDDEIDVTETFLEKLATVLPENIHAVVTAKFDRLTTVAQLVLKTSSVIGFTFTSVMLKEVFHDKDVELSGALDELVEAGFLIKVSRLDALGKGNSFKKHNLLHSASFESEGGSFKKNSFSNSDDNVFSSDHEYNFEHRLIFDSVYQLLLKEQKAAIHASLGKYYERRYNAFKKWSKRSADLSNKNSFHLKRLRSKRFSDMDIKRIDDVDLDQIEDALDFDGSFNGMQISEEELEGLNTYELHMKLAFHWSKTYYLPKGVSYLRLAGDYAVKVGAYMEAEELYLIAWAITCVRLNQANIDLDAELKKRETMKRFNSRTLSPMPASDLRHSFEAVSGAPTTIVSPLKRGEEEGEEEEETQKLERLNSSENSSTFRVQQDDLRRIRSLDSTVAESNKSPKSPLKKYSTLSFIPSMKKKPSTIDKSVNLQYFKALSFKELLTEGVMVSSDKTKYKENVRELLVAVTKDLCQLGQVYTRYRVKPRDDPRLAVEYLFKKAKLAQIYLKEYVTNSYDEKAMSYVYHCTAYNNLGAFQKEFDSFVEQLQRFDSKRTTLEIAVGSLSTHTVERSFTNAISMRKKMQDWTNIAESLNGLGTFYQMLLGKVKKVSHLVEAGKVHQLVEGGFPPLFKEILLARIAEKAPESDAELYDSLCSTLFEVSESNFLECLEIRQTHCRHELGQIETSLGNFYMGFHAELEKAESYLRRAIKSYAVTQGNRNPRSAYALHGLANCYVKKSEHASGDESRVKRFLYLGYSLCFLCVELRRLTLSDEDPLFKRTLTMLDSLDSQITWPWEKVVDRNWQKDTVSLGILFAATNQEAFLSYATSLFAELSFFVGWSSTLIAPVDQELPKTLLSVLCFFWLYHNDYEQFIRCQMKGQLKSLTSSFTLDAGAMDLAGIEINHVSSFPESPKVRNPLTSFYLPSRCSSTEMENGLKVVVKKKSERRSSLVPRYERSTSWTGLSQHSWDNVNPHKGSEQLDKGQFSTLKSIIFGQKTLFDHKNLLLTMIVVSNLFKIESYTHAATEYLVEHPEELTEGNTEKRSSAAAFEVSEASLDSSDRGILVKIISSPAACAKFLPSVSRLSDIEQEIIRRGFASGFDLRQFISLEAVPGSLKNLKKLALSDSLSYDLYLKHMILDIAGNQGSAARRQTSTLESDYTGRLIKVLAILDLLKLGFTESQVYDKYLESLAKMLCCQFETNERALIRLCGMLKVDSSENLVLLTNTWNLLSPSEKRYLAQELGRDGVRDGWAIVPHNVPQLLGLFIHCADELEDEEVESFRSSSDSDDNDNNNDNDNNSLSSSDLLPTQEEDDPNEFQSTHLNNASIALSFGLQLLVKIFRSTRVILNQSKLQDQDLNGVYVVKTANLGKEHVVRTILREKKFVKFTIFHENRTGEIVLGHS